MKPNWFKSLLPHLAAIVALLVLAVLYCKPVLEDKVISQSDNVQWQAMAKESMDYKKEHGIPPLWTTSMFGGMPTFQLAMESPYHIDSAIPAILTLGLPKPINVLFLSALCFYLLCVVIGARPWIGFAGAVAYTYASYSPIIIATGHDTKMVALAYLPAVIAGLILITRRSYLAGTGIMALSLSYLIAANHLQMTYYFFLILAIAGIAYAVYCIREKAFRHLITGSLLVILAVGLALASNAVSLWTTYQYSKESNRGGKSPLSPLPGETAEQHDGKEYAFQWSYGKFETLTLIAPDIYGGSSNGKLDENSQTYKTLTNIGVPPNQAARMVSSWNLYWGDQSILGTSGPVYLGVVVCLLALLGLFIIRSWHKWWLIGISVLGILLAWGSNFAVFNYFMFDHFPFYDKFRAPSQALIIPQLSFAILAVMALQELVSNEIKKEVLLQKLKWSGYIMGGLLVLLLLASTSARYTNASGDNANPHSDDQFHSQLVQQAQGHTEIADQLMAATRADRADLFRKDVFRSIFFAAFAFGLLWFFVKGKLQARYLTIGITILIMVDLIQVDRRYLNEDSFMDAGSYSMPFQATPADQQILQDKDPYYRVFNLTRNPFQDAMTSYFHKSVGGYHAAKLQLYQDLIERQISQNNLQVLNMLNTKYIITNSVEGPVVHRNPDALGNAWFVKAIQWVPDADAEMNALTNFHPKDTVVIDQQYKPLVNAAFQFDSSATISLLYNHQDTIAYKSKAATPQFAVFSEVYYRQGWKAYIDGKEAPYSRVNYALRGMSVPAGEHNITFIFAPEAYYAGVKLSLGSYIVMLILLTGSLALYFRKK